MLQQADIGNSLLKMLNVLKALLVAAGAPLQQPHFGLSCRLQQRRLAANLCSGR
jgi:hypothetical protein